MTVRIAINGFGRIGRSVVRALYESGKTDLFTLVSINELAPSTGIAHLLKYDSTHGRFAFDVSQTDNQLVVDGDEIALTHIGNLNSLPWQQQDIDIVLDCTGKYGSRADGLSHINRGAKKVLFSMALSIS